MSLLGDFPGEMQRLPLDLDTADRLLAGSIAPADAPPGYARVAVMLATLESFPSERPASDGRDRHDRGRPGALVSACGNEDVKVVDLAQNRSRVRACRRHPRWNDRRRAGRRPSRCSTERCFEHARQGRPFGSRRRRPCRHARDCSERLVRPSAGPGVYRRRHLRPGDDDRLDRGREGRRRLDARKRRQEPRRLERCGRCGTRCTCRGSERGRHGHGGYGERWPQLRGRRQRNSGPITPTLGVSRRAGVPCASSRGSPGYTGLPRGGVPEWFKGAVLKTARPREWSRGFESHPRRLARLVPSAIALPLPFS